MSHLEGVSYAVFAIYLLSFIALSNDAGRQAGRSIWLFSEGPRLQRLSAMLFRLAFVISAFWPLAQTFGFDPIRNDPMRYVVDGVVSDLVGHLMVTIGASVAIIGQLHMGASWRIGTAEGEVGAIVDTGPFAVSRNPVFVGQLLLFAGLFWVFPSVVQLVLFATIFAAIHIQVRIVEEDVLAASLGQPYLNYMKRVMRWVGTS